MIDTIAVKQGSYFGEKPGLLVGVAFEAPTLETFHFIHDMHEAAVERWGSVSLLTVIPRYGGPLDVAPPVQRERAERMRAFGNRVVGNACAVTVDGLQGVTLRLIVGTLHLMQAGRVEMTTTSTVRDAMEWTRALPHQRPELQHDAALESQVDAFVATVERAYGVVDVARARAQV